MKYVESPEEQGWMISEVTAVPGVRHVIVFSPDGLLLASSGGIDRDTADRLAANCAGLHSLGRSLGREFGAEEGTVHQQMVGYDGGYLFLRSAHGAHLAAVTGPAVDPRLVARQMRSQVISIGAARLSSPARQNA
ncbi:roadblock/LC7 domain-containing protein [Streptomyces sp. NPDC059853]|uniref:roadblock/LC7 domain-containing protein n=1 Tax=Streptomyces sp. NPDC059853 TaxID=3346973 RepID=UPI003657A450